MSHENVEPGRPIVYQLPPCPSDLLRTLQFSRFFSDYRGPAFSVRTADGWSWSSSTCHEPGFIATFRSREQLDTVIEDATEAALGRMFLNGDLNIQGEISALLAAAEYTLHHSEDLSGSLLHTISRVTLDISRKLNPLRANATSRNRRATTPTPCPMDLPSEFFEPWLGMPLGHSCALFPNLNDGPKDNFATAQKNALERECTWLNLERGDRLLDVNCGWGSLALHAAQHFGADVQAVASTGLQADLTADRICRSSLERRCAVECRDLRSAPYRAQTFDKIAHIGIFEPIATADFPGYLACLQSMLVPGGLLLLHRVTRSREVSPAVRATPAGFLCQSLSREMDMAESANLEILSVDSLQREYEQTLCLWIEHLRQSWISDQARAFDHEYRVWLLYLVEVATSLQAGDLRIHRILLRRPRAKRASVE